MARERIRLVISDFHLGAGSTLPDGGANFLEDFFHDRKLIEFLDYHSSGDYARAEVELVINGDFFNHLQVWPDEKSPELMTEAVARMRTEAIMAGHPGVFDAIGSFAATPRHSVTFMVGNHDMGLLWPSVGEFVSARLGPNVRVHPDPIYAEDGVWIEHGNQHVAENRIDFDHPFLEKGFDEPIINMPWGDLFVIRFLNRMKRKRPYVDKVYPFRFYLRWALIHDTLFALKAAMMGAVYFMAVLLRIGENRRFARQQFMKIMKEFSFPVKMDRAAKRLLALHPGYNIVVFGHGHKAAAKQFAGGKEYFNTGIWNEMISLDIGTMGRQLLLSFVEISYDHEGQPHGRLREWKGEYREVEEMGLI
ncbi:MAG: hypothetical protein V2A66_05940 [Pseudomonadota bacterium]